MLTVEKIEDIGGFEALKPEWNELLLSSAADCLFLTWEWMFTWWKHLSGGRRLHLLVVRRDGTLVAIAPLAVRPRQTGRLIPFRVLEFLGMGTVGSDYLDLIIRRGHEDDVLTALAINLSANEQVIELAHVDMASKLVAELAQRLDSDGWSIVQSVTDECPYIDLSGQSWESYVASLGPSHRRNVRRRIKFLAQQRNFKFDRARSEQERSAYFKSFLELHYKRWNERHGSDAINSKELTSFHDEWSQHALRHGWLRLYLLSLDGVAVASIYAFNYGEVFYLYQAGFDPAYKQQSVGLVAIGLTIRDAFEEGARAYDFLHGHEKYKYLWSHECKDLIKLDCYPPSATGALYKQMMGVRDGIKNIVHLPDRIRPVGRAG